MNDTSLSSYNPLVIHYDLEKNIKMSISEKIKRISNKIEQNKAQYDLDRQIAKISALSSEIVSKYFIFD